MAELKLKQWIGKPNIADAFTTDQLNQLGTQVVRDWEADLATREDWEKRTKEGLDLAMQVAESKSWPWPNAANVKYPLIASAAIQFHARAYPEIVRGNNVVKGKVIGRDTEGVKQQRADRISKHMSYQLLEEMVEWEEDTDRLLMMLPIIGTLFKKTYFDPLRQRNVSCLRKPLGIVVHNDAKSLDDARRVTDQDVFLYRNDVHERKAAGLFVDEDITFEHDEEKQQAEMFLEQHMYYDLDEDGYEEPYVVTVHKASAKVVRVAARYDEDSVYVTDSGKLMRIEPIQYFTKFSFLPSFDGSFYDVGFGQLLHPINEAINTNLNQLLDAGTLANVQGGLVSRGIKIKGGQYQFRPGEWKQTDASPADLKDGFFPLPTKEPSAVLFQLLGFLVDAGKTLSSVADIMTGEQAGPNEPVGTALARIEQGMKVFSSIHKRIYRSLKAEYKKIAVLNRKYMDDEYYFRVLDEEQIAIRADYNDKDVDVVPVADPAQGTDVLRMAKANALMPLQGAPGVDSWQVTRRYLEAINIENIEEIQPDEGKETAGQTPPDPKMVEVQGKLEIEKDKLQLSAEKQEAEIALIDAQIETTRADGILKLAQAEAQELGPQLEYYKGFAEQLQQQIAGLQQPKAAQGVANDTGMQVDGGAVQGLEVAGSDAGGFQMPEGIPQAAGGEIPIEGVDGADLQGSIPEGGDFAGA
jgi:chaperonin GroES